MPRAAASSTSPDRDLLGPAPAFVVRLLRGDRAPLRFVRCASRRDAERVVRRLHRAGLDASIEEVGA